MADFTNLKDEIKSKIKSNGKQEITGAVLQQTMLEMIDETDRELTELSAEIISNSLSLLGGYKGHYENASGGLKEVARFYLGADCEYKLHIEASKVITAEALYSNGLYLEDGTRIANAYIGQNQSSATSDTIKVTERTLVILKSELTIAFDWEMSITSNYDLSEDVNKLTKEVAEIS